MIMTTARAVRKACSGSNGELQLIPCMDSLAAAGGTPVIHFMNLYTQLLHLM
jgi:hypothetical protein